MLLQLLSAWAQKRVDVAHVIIVAWVGNLIVIDRRFTVHTFLIKGCM